VEKKYVTIYEVLFQLAGIMDWANQISRPKYVDIEIRPKMDGVNGWLDFDKQDILFQRGYIEAKERLLDLQKTNPTVWAAISEKVKYPPEILEAPKPVPQKKLTWMHLVIPLVFNPKVLLIFLSCFGVYQIASNLLSFFRILSTVSQVHRYIFNVMYRIKNAALPHYTRL